jgi:hypothetical protein
MGCATGMKPVLPPYSPPHPLARHIRTRSDTYVADKLMAARTTTLYLRKWIPTAFSTDADLRAQQRRMVSDSTHFPSSTPFLGPQSNPWTYLRTSNAFGGRRGGMAESTATMHLSLVLLVGPSHTAKLHSVTLRSVRRDSSLHQSTNMASICAIFAELSGRRHASCSLSLLKHLSLASSSSRDRSPPSGSDACKVRPALDAGPVIVSLRVLEAWRGMKRCLS